MFCCVLLCFCVHYVYDVYVCMVCSVVYGVVQPDLSLLLGLGLLVKDVGVEEPELPPWPASSFDCA